MCAKFAVMLLLLGVALAAPAAAQPRIEVEAVLGQPLGVGRIVADLPKSALPLPLGAAGLGLTERSGRVLYPVIHDSALTGILTEALAESSPLTEGSPIRAEVGGLLRGILDRGQSTTLYFLFRGDAPLELTLQAREAHALVVRPRAAAKQHRRLLQAWWRQYSAPGRLLRQKPDYPPQVENFLTSTLARRLNLRLPDAKHTKTAVEQLQQELGLFLGSESLRVAMEQDRVLGLTDLGLAADRPLPVAVEPPPLEVPEPPADVKIEPIALRVPAECFYVRFGNYANFLWMQDTLDTWGGDLQNLWAQRGIDCCRGRRIQDQLVLHRSQLGDLTGGLLISDVAIIGTDMFFAEGAAYGLLFEARNAGLLSANFRSDRAARIARGGVTEQKITLEGQDVSLLASPDGSVRSYLVTSGDYVLLSTSATLVRRFLQTAGGGGLGASKEFRYVRGAMPLSRDDTLLVYFSDAFFRNLTGPRYRVELTRRLQAVADIEVLQLAKLDAATEGKAGGSIEELIAGGLLPADFTSRPDGSRAVLARGEVYDQLRGHRGALVPVPDVPIERVTAAEETAYRKFVDFYQSQWGRIDPVTIAVKRHELPGKRDRVVIDARMIPFARRHVEFLRQWAGPADRTALAPVPGDMAAGEFVMRNQRLLAGLRDVSPPLAALEGRPVAWTRLRDTLVGYLGTFGEPGILGLVNATIPSAPDANGYASNVLGLWRRQSDRFTVFSFQRDVLETVTPQLHFQDAPGAAQLRLHVGDVSHARITPLANQLAYARTRETSLGNLRLLQAMNQQLHVPPASCREAAEFLLAAKLVCPLGGQYVLREAPGGPARWTSTALEQQDAGEGLLPGPPQGYVAPPLNWFRGLDLDATLGDAALSAHAEIIMQLPGK
ncbi:MAG: hypothetical protein ABSG68_08875 [Thermoguttaceae bacterium]